MEGLARRRLRRRRAHIAYSLPVFYYFSPGCTIEKQMGVVGIRACESQSRGKYIYWLYVCAGIEGWATLLPAFRWYC